MALQMAIGPPDLETGEVVIESRPVLPTHYKCPQSGAAMPVENPEVWVYQDDLNDTQEPA